MASCFEKPKLTNCLISLSLNLEDRLPVSCLLTAAFAAALGAFCFVVSGVELAGTIEEVTLLFSALFDPRAIPWPPKVPPVPPALALEPATPGRNGLAWISSSCKNFVSIFQPTTKTSRSKSNTHLCLLNISKPNNKSTCVSITINEQGICVSESPMAIGTLCILPSIF